MRCAVFGCNENNAKKKGCEISYHSFPKQKTVRDMWIFLCQRKDKFNVDNARICSKHFTTEDFNVNPFYAHYGIKMKPRLKPNIVPSLLLSTKNMVKLSIPTMQQRSLQSSLPTSEETEQNCVSPFLCNDLAATDKNIIDMTTIHNSEIAIKQEPNLIETDLQNLSCQPTLTSEDIKKEIDIDLPIDIDQRIKIETDLLSITSTSSDELSQCVNDDKRKQLMNEATEIETVEVLVNPKNVKMEINDENDNKDGILESNEIEVPLAPPAVDPLDSSVVGHVISIQTRIKISGLHEPSSSIEINKPVEIKIEKDSLNPPFNESEQSGNDSIRKIKTMALLNLENVKNEIDDENSDGILEFNEVEIPSALLAKDPLGSLDDGSDILMPKPIKIENESNFPMPFLIKNETKSSEIHDIGNRDSILSPPVKDPLSSPDSDIPIPKLIKIEKESLKIIHILPNVASSSHDTIGKVETMAKPYELQTKSIKETTINQESEFLNVSSLTLSPSESFINIVKEEIDDDNEDDDYFGPYEVIEIADVDDDESVPKRIKLEENSEIAPKRISTADAEPLVKSWVMWKIETPKERQIRLTKERVQRWNVKHTPKGSGTAILKETLIKKNRITKLTSSPMSEYSDSE